jgi:hypothetical protein
MLAGLASLNGSARALGAVVAFSAVGTIPNTSNGEEVDNSTTYRFAWQAARPVDAETVTVNGVTFHASPTTVTPSGITITHNALDGFPGRAPGTYGADMFTLMDDAISTQNDFPNNVFTLTLNGLSLGGAYRVQFLMLDSAAALGNRDMRIESGANSTGTFSSFPVGRFVFANFIADATTQAFNFVPDDGLVNSDRALLSGIAIFEVPEPSIGLSIIGIVGLLARRRRTRA